MNYNFTQTQSSLSKSKAPQEPQDSIKPYSLFIEWINLFKSFYNNDENLIFPMVLSTISTEESPNSQEKIYIPSSRTVLLKKYEQDCFYFFTNYDSQKAKEIQENSYVSLHFYWGDLHKQIRIQGQAQKTSLEISKDYFATRPRASQIAAHASPQSDEIPSGKVLTQLYLEKEELFKNEKEVPLPENWGGYVVAASYYEFWQERENRLHDRLLYKKEKNLWKKKRLAP